LLHPVLSPSARQGPFALRAVQRATWVWGLITWVGQVAAQPDAAGASKGARLQFGGAPCADRAELQRSVRRRSERVHWTDGDRTDDTLVAVDITPADLSQPWRATLQFSGGGQPPLVRALAADDCRTVIDAAALVIAITLDPPSVSEPVSDPPEPGPVVPPVVPGREPPAVVFPESDWELPVPPRSSEWNLGLGAVWTGGMAPGGGFGPVLLGSAAVAGGRFAAWRPALQGALQYVIRDGVRADLGVAHFRLSAGSLELCPARWGTADWTVGGCLLAVGGALQVRGDDTLEPESHTRPWAVVGASLAADVRIHGPWRCLAKGAAGATVVRDTFRFEPEVVHAVPRWAPMFTLAVVHEL